MNTIEEIKKRKIFILMILLIFIVILLVILSVVLNNKKSEEEAEFTLSYNELKTVEDVIKYYKCKFISLDLSKDRNYNFDVKLEFCKLLYENDISNETFYMNVIKDVARISDYVNFRLLDEKNDIKIEVICDSGKIYNIIINGIEDYFIYMDSQISVKAYKEIPVTNFNIEAPILIEAMSNQWIKDINLGTRDSIYNKYNIYFDEGISVRIINSKINNMIFTDKYVGTVINGITPGMAFSNIKSILGNPTFEDKELEIIGYKGEHFYIFFNKNEISVYRTIETDADEFFRLVDEFLNDEIDFLEMMNKLTYMWPDYSEYNYTSEKVFISYPQKGVDIKINYDNTTGIIIYNNFDKNITRIKTYMENTEFIGKLQVDNVFEAEKKRIRENLEEKEIIEEYKKENVLPGYVSMVYDCYPILEDNTYITKVKFIAKDNMRPNRELNDTIDSYLWINDTTFMFSKTKDGIYLYDLNTGTVRQILSGEENFEIESYQNGVLKYDEKELQMQF